MLDWNICTLSERSVVFHFYGRCEILTLNDANDQVITASFGYVGGVFANVSDGGYSGTANEVVTKCDQFLTQDQKGVIWNFNYNFGWYSPSLHGTGSETGGVSLSQLFPFI